MTDEEWDAVAWQHMQDHAPLCSCGTRFRLGGTNELGPLLVCLSCSSVEAVDPQALEALQEQAREYADRLDAGGSQL